MSKRKVYLVDRDIQYGLLKSQVVSTLAIIVLCAFYLLLVQVIVPEHDRPSIHEKWQLILKLTGLLIVVFVLVLGIYSIVQSHRIAGAAYNIRRTLATLAEGDLEARVKLRDKDYLQDLAEAVNALGESLAVRKGASAETVAFLASVAESESIPADTRARARELAARLAGERSGYADSSARPTDA